MKKAIIAAVVALVALGALGGLGSIVLFELEKMAEAQQRREADSRYAQMVEGEITGLLSRFTKAAGSQADDLSVDTFLQISADAKFSREVLESSRPPRAAVALRDDAVELVTLVGDTSSAIAVAVTYASLVESATESLKGNISSSPESLSAFATDVRSTEKQIKSVAAKLKNAVPPAPYEAFNTKLKSILSDFAEAADEVAGAAELNKYDSVLRSIQDIDKATKQLDSLTGPESTTVFNEAFSDSDRRQIKALTEQIDSAITKLNSKASK